MNFEHISHHFQQKWAVSLSKQAFGSLEVLLKMCDGVIQMEQAFKMRHGNEKPE